MDAEKATVSNGDGFEVARMARLLGVSRSGYYDWVKRQTAGPSPAQQRRGDLTSKIITFHAESDRVYGSPRILADLREAGEHVSGKTVATLMRRSGIVGISPRGFVPVTTQPGPDLQPVPDLVGRRFDQGQLNRVWTSDITYLSTGEGWLYLCAVRDGCSRRVLGWAVEDHLRTDLVEAALRRAVTLRGELPEKVIFHADRGTQGGFNWSSQHLVIRRVCDGTWQGGETGPSFGRAAAVGGGSGVAAADAITGPAGAVSSGAAGLLAADRVGGDDGRGRGGRWCVMAGRRPLVPSRWRHAADPPERAYGPLPVVRRARGDRAAARPGGWCARDRPPDRTRPGNRFSRAAPQRGDQGR
jgi:hypothetical protein